MAKPGAGRQLFHSVTFCFTVEYRIGATWLAGKDLNQFMEIVKKKIFFLSVLTNIERFLLKLQREGFS